MCESDFYLTATGGCDPRTYTIDNCVEYSSATTCSVCATEYYPTSSNTVCTKDSTPIADCKVQSSDTACSLCMDGFALTTDGSLCLSNCIVVGDSGCDQCDSKFYFDETTHACVSTTSANCLYFSTSETLCTGCSPGLVLLNSQCMASSSLGDTCTTRGSPTCLICQTGYAYDAATKSCVTKTSNTTPCKYVNSDGSCKSCPENTYSNNGVCSPLAPNPQTCSCFSGRNYYWPAV